MDSSITLSALLEEIAQDEAALAKKRMVAEFLRERLRQEGGMLPEHWDRLVDTPPQGVLAASLSSSLSESISESVLKAVHEVGNREFTVADIYAILVSRGVKFKSSTPKVSIATALARLVRVGVLKLTFKGSGTIPNRFRRADDGTQQATDQASDMEGSHE